jgi:hypothetical protein
MRKKQKIAMASVLFIFETLLFTRIDYLINCDFSKYGLKYSEGWGVIYQLMYFLLFQMTIVWIYLFTRSWKLCIVLEAFVLSAGPDLIYFGLWGKGQFPTGEWTWMPLYKVFGTCTTQMQIVFTSIATATAIILVGIKRFRGGV